MAVENLSGDVLILVIVLAITSGVFSLATVALAAQLYRAKIRESVLREALDHLQRQRHGDDGFPSIPLGHYSPRGRAADRSVYNNSPGRWDHDRNDSDPRTFSYRKTYASMPGFSPMAEIPVVCVGSDLQLSATRLGPSMQNRKMLRASSRAVSPTHAQPEFVVVEDGPLHGASASLRRADKSPPPPGHMLPPSSSSPAVLASRPALVKHRLVSPSLTVLDTSASPAVSNVVRSPMASTTTPALPEVALVHPAATPTPFNKASDAAVAELPECTPSANKTQRADSQLQGASYVAVSPITPAVALTRHTVATARTGSEGHVGVPPPPSTLREPTLDRTPPAKRFSYASDLSHYEPDVTPSTFLNASGVHREPEEDVQSPQARVAGDSPVPMTAVSCTPTTGPVEVTANIAACGGGGDVGALPAVRECRFCRANMRLPEVLSTVCTAYSAAALAMQEAVDGDLNTGEVQPPQEEKTHESIFHDMRHVKKQKKLIQSLLREHQDVDAAQPLLEALQRDYAVYLR